MTVIIHISVIAVRLAADSHRNVPTGPLLPAQRLSYRVPSLRERAEDIPLLAEYLIERHATKAGKRIRKISRPALTLFQAYDWPGNIRELQNVIERAVILCDGDTFSVDETWLARDSKAPAGPSMPIGSSLPQQQRIQAETERLMIETALAATRGRIAGTKGAAAKLGIPVRPSTRRSRPSVSTSISTRAAEPVCHRVGMPTDQQILKFQRAATS